LVNSRVNLYVSNEPVVESSTNLTFAPYNWQYTKQDEHIQAAGLDKQMEVNRWNLIHDFTPKGEGELNYVELDTEEWEMKVDELEDVEGEIGEIFPYPERYGGTIEDTADFTQDKNVFGGDNAFDIKDGKKEA
tara:strand:+ start:276 stop:674 length:399 start_codon:yes stop_codon:yes gene_type:complete